MFNLDEQVKNSCAGELSDVQEVQVSTLTYECSDLDTQIPCICRKETGGKADICSIPWIEKGPANYPTQH